MFNLYDTFLQSLQLLDADYKKHKFLLAVSGGADSVALAKLAKSVGLSAVVAHCHFHLRGDESDADAHFVEAFSKVLGYDFYRKDFDTVAFAKISGVSIQMAARTLRYQWFYELLNEYDLDYILIAHHKDDQIETMLINMVRGTGVRGLSGMPEKNDKVLRPMLSISRTEIEAFLTQENQSFRTDSSNSETKYLRNSIRHKIIPEFQQIDASFGQRMLENSERFAETVKVLDDLLAYVEKDLVTEATEKDVLNIDITHRLASPALLYELLRKYGFNRTQIDDLYFSEISGKYVSSETFTLLTDRNRWQLFPKKNSNAKDVLIDGFDFEIFEPLHLKARLKNATEVSMSKTSDKAEIDVSELKLPLTVRRWKQGDVFQPLGMKGHQKLSDFFINRKLSLREKENTYLLCSGDEIVWVIGLQMNDKFKLVKGTKQVLCVEVLIPIIIGRSQKTEDGKKH